MTPEKINVTRFLELSEMIQIADVRSPSEYNFGHIPEAVSIPLFDDKERKAVGTKYVKEGRLPAILEGLKHTGPELSSKLKKALKIAKNGKILVHCWRGGMRSEAMAWLFSLGDLDVKVLDGGYKSYRRHVTERLSEKRKMIILGGMTGSSKTHILKYIRSIGQQVIDLEGLANHKGSAFGSLGQAPQPTSEQFSNMLFNQCRLLNADLPFVIEDESRNIGTVTIPEVFYLNMQESPTVVLMMDLKTRLPRLIEEYSFYDPESLKASVLRINKRLGGEKTRDAIDAVEKGDFAKAIEIVLYYYDKAYMFGLKNKKHKSENIIYINSDSDNIESNAMKVMEAAGRIKW